MKAAQSLVIGAGGQVGAAICDVLGPQVLAPARTATAENPVAVDLVELARNPLLAEKLLGSLSPDAIYCVGGATNVERCESDHAWAMDTNCHGPAVLAKAARHLPFVYFSTEYVFDGCDGPYQEDAPTNPLSVYGRSKLEGEQRILDAHPDPLIVRTTVVYGPERQGKNFIYTLMRLLGSGQNLKVPFDQVSSPTYNKDLARATVELLRRGHRGIFNVCGPEVLSRLEFAQRAAGILGLDVSLLQAVSTAELNQKAARPLKAGMLIDKLNKVSPYVRMRTVEEVFADWSITIE